MSIDFLWHPRLQLHAMPPLDLLAKYLIHQPLLLQHTEPSEPLAHNLDPVHGTASTRNVLNLYVKIVVSASNLKSDLQTALEPHPMSAPFPPPPPDRDI